jgi:cobalamin transport system permease protein
MKHSHLTFRRAVVILSVLMVALVVVAVLGVSIGSTTIGLREMWSAVRGESGERIETVQTILFQLRLPRVILAIVVGAGLSVAGAALQSLLRNPLAEPFILGISSGGTVGAFLAISLGLGFSQFTTPLVSFAGSGLVMFLVYSLGHRQGILDPNALLLSGVMVGAFFNAIILVAVALFNQELQTAYLWMLGSLGSADNSMLVVVAPIILLASLVLVIQSKALNLIATGEESASQFGVNVERVRKLSYLLASLITGLAVSVSGVIGFVGLLVPHGCRLLFGSDNRIVMPASILLGGIFLVLCDLLSRTLLAPTEIPVGAITAAVGAPMFVYLLKRS